MYNGILTNGVGRVLTNFVHRRNFFFISSRRPEEQEYRRIKEIYSSVYHRERQLQRWSIHIWGGIAYTGKTNHLIKGNLTCQRYVNQILNLNVVQFIKRVRHAFQQDNARAHVVRFFGIPTADTD